MRFQAGFEGRIYALVDKLSLRRGRELQKEIPEHVSSRTYGTILPDLSSAISRNCEFGAIRPCEAVCLHRMAARYFFMSIAR